jgi:hypothetical protein
VEESGPVRVTIYATGWYVSAKTKEKLCIFKTRISAFAGQPFLHITHSTVLTYDTEKKKLADVGFLVAHAPDKIRADSLACNIYASDTQKFSALIGAEGLSEEAAAKCLEQLNQMQDNWSHILGPHLRYAEQSVE